MNDDQFFVTIQIHQFSIFTIAFGAAHFMAKRLVPHIMLIAIVIAVTNIFLFSRDEIKLMNY